MLSSTILAGALCVLAAHIVAGQEFTCGATNATDLEVLIAQANAGSGGSSGGTSGGVANNQFLNTLNDNLNGAMVNAGSSFSAAAGGTFSFGIKSRRHDGHDDNELTCTKDEVCLSLRTVIFCCEPVSGDYHLHDERGNLITGNYTLDSGEKGNLFVASNSTSASATGGTSSTTDGAAASTGTTTTSKATSVQTCATGASGPTKSTGAADISSVSNVHIGGLLGLLAFFFI